MTCTNQDIVDLLIESDAIAADDEVVNDSPLKQMGVQSLDKFNLFLAIEEKFGVEIPDDDFEKLDSISSISSYVDERMNG